MGTRYTDTIDLTGALAMAPGETRVVDNPTLRIPDLIMVKRQSGDRELIIDESLITATTISVHNPGTLANESVLGVGFRFSVIK